MVSIHKEDMVKAKTFLLILLSCSFAPVNQGLTQSLPECTSSGSDTDGDGYGWENEQSCVVVAAPAVCEDRGDYPWGWNPVTLQSCRLDSTACVDTDPVNDGWGWNGVTSCRVATAPDLDRCDDVGMQPWGWNPTISATCRLDLVESPDISNYADHPVIAINDMVDVPLICKKLIQVYYCNCDNSTTDELASADEYDDLFFTATLRGLNQTEDIRAITYETLTMDGSWRDSSWANELPLYRSMDASAGLQYAPSPGQSYPFFGSLTYNQNGAGDIFIQQLNALAGGNDLTVVSHCVVR